MSLKRLIAFLVSLVVMVTGLFILSYEVMKEVKVNDGTKVIVVRTSAKTVGEVLKKSGIDIRDGDQVEPALASKIQRGMEIDIVKAKTAYVVVDGKKIDVRTDSRLAKDILNASGVIVGKDDKVIPGIDHVFPDVKDRTLEVIRVKAETKTVNEEIPYHTIIKMTKSLKSGEIKKIAKGTNGLSLMTYKIVRENGKEVSREIVNEEVLTAAKPEILNKGVDKYVVTNRGMPFRYKEVIIMRSSAYDLSIESCGKAPGTPGFGRTRSGTQARKGVVAVDPSVIPLGTKLYVESIDGDHDYGFASAEDTGSAIKGNRIDLFYDDRSTALDYGRREVRVYIMEDKVTEDMMKSKAF